MTVKASAIGQRVTWDTLPGKPSVFAPSAHTHAWGDITGKPSLYPPSTHTHAIADVTGLQAALDGKATTGSVTWSNLSGKPSTFPPSAHTHVWTDITDRPTVAPLGIATPKADGTATAGTSTNAAREDHVHPIAPGTLVYIGDVNITETLLISLAVGMKRKTFALAGVAANDRLIAIPTAAPTTGCEVINAYPASAGNVSFGYYTPLLGIGATYSVPVAVYRVA